MLICEILTLQNKDLNFKSVLNLCPKTNKEHENWHVHVLHETKFLFCSLNAFPYIYQQGILTFLHNKHILGLASLHILCSRAACLSLKFSQSWFLAHEVMMTILQFD